MLNKETIKGVFQIFTGGLSDWSFRESQVVSPLYSFSEANKQFIKIEEKLTELGIKIENNLIFLVESRTEKGKQRIVVDNGKFNHALDSEKLSKLKDVITEIKSNYLKSLESGEVGSGRGAYILENYIDKCNQILDFLSQEQPTLGMW